MKTNVLRNLINITLLLAFIGFTSCSSDDDSNTLPAANERDGLVKIQELSNDTHTIALYSRTGSLQQGYNAISLRIKDKATGQYESDAEVSFEPLMHMMMMTHSCPKSNVRRTAGKTTLYSGYIIFQMAQNDTEYWTLTVNYTLDGTAYTATGQISVPASGLQRVTSFTGTDGAKYIVALIEPETPRVALNNMTAAVYRMESMTSFPIANGHTIKLDPRMPGMGNHGSPNNVPLVQSATDQLYHGKLSLTMTGYWRINLQLYNATGDLLKGEAITGDVAQSSIYFETEF